MTVNTPFRSSVQLQPPQMRPLARHLPPTQNEARARAIAVALSSLRSGQRGSDGATSRFHVQLCAGQVLEYFTIYNLGISAAYPTSAETREGQSPWPSGRRGAHNARQCTASE